MKTVLTRLLVSLVVLLIALVPSLAAAQIRIVIDPGHGGSDPGGVGTGMQEKTIVLNVAQRFKALLDADTADTSGGGRWVALLTRNTDTFVSLAARAAFSNNQDADRFMSIHANAFADASAHGTETFAFSESGQGAALRNLVQSEMIAAWGLTNRGNKTANFAVLRDTAAPAVLHELAFITNATDAAKLGSATERQKAAVAHLRAIQRHFGITPFVPSAFASTAGPGDTTDSGGDGPQDVGDPDPGSDGGCSTASGTSGAFAAFALLGFASIARRRRR
jgi:MYXO-CTERM domain-containing protein